jgi:hypothetical protein
MEELERTFLRRMNGMAAVRELIDIVDATSHTLFWVLSTNEITYRYLRAAVDLNRCFSHRINAMSVSQDAIVAAILQRHNLSGLRLQFAPLPRRNGRMSGVRKIVGLKKEPEAIFFNSLFRQSEGIFRSAFELWQDCIERVEGGVVHIRQPLEADYGSLRRELRLPDLFALRAVLQHGSLTPDELVAVLRVDIAAARQRIRRFQGLEIVEPEPASPGFRVRPQAGRFVREALHGENLF